MKKKSIGIILSNLGSPNEPNSKSVRIYLQEFLSDPLVVQIPRFIWLPILYGLILPLRSRKSAKLYQKIWTAEGSPLIHISKKQAELLQAHLNTVDQNIHIVCAMRYGNPSLNEALKTLKERKITDLIIFPLYPQYSRAATESTLVKIRQLLKAWPRKPKTRQIDHYATNANYIEALANSLKEHWQLQPPGEKLLFSFHGLPLRSIAEGDPYYALCHQTARAVANKLELSDDQWVVVFQSRFGLEPWLQPYCDIMLETLAKRGYKNLDIICPGFAADCLETLEEIKVLNTENFIKAGGKQLNYIPALNTRADHIAALANIILETINP